MGKKEGTFDNKVKNMVLESVEEVWGKLNIF